ncbi:GNAT family N-acetyltransferase [Luteimonas sp. SX5]|uniref:GNAT family N-acetyltransferase n=1 Tax=Luteimonas galliterrae TaxID=2940486 RepID=A0ABT0MIQ6_9GAMM|nr:GNAT family N-acetyltransferase [Luteimonas galliterrae]MCL1634745.1 GNAT family N-acetyltransferase [Luteimonas galliterrae]
MAAEYRIEDYAAQWRDDFARLNIDWLQRYFVVEAIDNEVLHDPETHILGHGGHILFAVGSNDRAIGTVALKHEGGGVYELTKMAVGPGHQGAGIGRALMMAALETYRRLKGRELFLESSSKLTPALILYESVGFVHKQAPRPGSHYQRADVYMVWEPGDTP